MTYMRDIHEEFTGRTILEGAYAHGHAGGTLPIDATPDWTDAWSQGRQRWQQDAARPRPKQFQGPNGWYWATENADGFHHQPSWSEGD